MLRIVGRLGAERGRNVIRGGSFDNNQENARSAYRNNNQADEQNQNLGFRLAGGCGTGFKRLLPEFRRGIGGSVQIHFRVAVQTG